MEFEALDFVTGVVATLAAAILYVLALCRQNLRRLLGNLVKGGTHNSLARNLPLEPRTVPADWIKSGSPVFKSCEYGESPDKRSSSGIWSCDGPSTFEWQFGSDEFVFVLEGRVEIDYLGQHFVLEPGDTALFYAGTRSLWSVPKYVRKSYMVHYPNILVRLVRALLGTARSR